MMSIIIAILLGLGIISSPEQATEQVIKDNKAEIQAVIGDDYDAF